MNDSILLAENARKHFLYSCSPKDPHLCSCAKMKLYDLEYFVVQKAHTKKCMETWSILLKSNQRFILRKYLYDFLATMLDKQLCKNVIFSFHVFEK